MLQNYHGYIVKLDKLKQPDERLIYTQKAIENVRKHAITNVLF